MTTTLTLAKDLTENAFYLPTPKKSIFVGDFVCREYPDMPLIYGFIHKQMGIKLRKKIAEIYPDEQTHYKNYCKKYNHEDECIETKYYLPKHNWGRIQPVGSLSLSLFHRPSRHSFCEKNYLDFDMVNMQPQVLLELSKKAGLKLKGGLEKYCSNSKQFRYEIASYYKLEEIVYDDGTKITPYEQAKKLPLRIAFGGSLKEWKKDFVKVRILNDMPLVKNIIEDLNIICDKVLEINPHIKEDLLKYGSDEWKKKTDKEKNRSLFALYSQTLERIIQEECISHFSRLYKTSIYDIVPSQDGFMPLKKVIEDKNINVDELFKEFHKIIFEKFGLNLYWSRKEFDEKIFIPRSYILPIEITLNDLKLGEAVISKIIYPALKNKLVYDGTTNLWYYTDKNNIWLQTKYANDYLIVTTIQLYIKKLEEKYWNEYNNITLNDNTDNESDTDSDDDTDKEDNKAKRKRKKKEIDEINRFYNSVGKSSYISQTVKYLRTLLTDNDFHNKLDNTGGKIVFKDGIFDLKMDKFNYGFRKEDYISFTLGINYEPNYDAEKMKKLREILKQILNWNDEHLEYYLSVIGYAFTGDSHLEKSIYYIVDGTGGKGDNGKTFMFDILKHIFPEYVKQTDPSLLEEANTKTHKQLPVLNNARIVWADEGTKKKLNASLMKKIGDGKDINTTVMYGNAKDFKVTYKMFVCSNHLPKIDKNEEAVYNRYKQIQFCSHFDRTGIIEQDDYEALEFIADPTLSDKLKKEYVNEIIGIVLEYAVKYYKNGIPKIPQHFIEAVNKTKNENNEFAKWFHSRFVSMVGKNISLDYIVEVYGVNDDKEGRKMVLEEMKGLHIKYNKDLVGFGTKEVEGKTVKIKGGFEGYAINENWNEEED